MKLRLLLTCVLVLTGCASGPPQGPLFVESTAPLAPPPADKAQIIFVDPANAVQAAFPAWLFEIRGTGNTALAVMGAHSKSVQLVAPGHHVFGSSTAVGGLPAHVMEADVVAGKRYYVLVRFIYARGMQLRPIRPSGPSEYAATSKDFAGWLSGSTYFVPALSPDEFDKKFSSSFTKTGADGLADWNTKTAAQRAELTLNAEDAIDR